MEKNVTKREFYTALINFANGGTLAVDRGEDGIYEITNDEIIEFAENEIALLDKRGEKAKERAAKKKTEADPIKEAVLAILANAEDFMTANDVKDQIEDEDITKSKISNRLTQLFNAGIVEKAEVSVVKEDGKKGKRMAYKIIPGDAE